MHTVQTVDKSVLPENQGNPENQRNPENQANRESLKALKMTVSLTQ